MKLLELIQDEYVVYNKEKSWRVFVCFTSLEICLNISLSLYYHASVLLTHDCTLIDYLDSICFQKAKILTMLSVILFFISSMHELIIVSVASGLEISPDFLDMSARISLLSRSRLISVPSTDR